MRNNLYFVIACICCFRVMNVYAQVDTAWTKTFGGSNLDEGYAVQQTADGGFIVGGYTSSSGSGGNDLYLIKMNSGGGEAWEKTYGGSGAEYGYAVEQTFDGGFILAGYTQSFGAGGSDFYLVRTTASGDTLWARTFGGSGADLCYSVWQASDGGFVAAGYTNSSGAGNYDVYLVKTDSSGNEEWEKTFGGGNDDRAYSIRQTTDGGFILAGYTSSSGAGSADVFLMKTTANGDSVWATTFGGTTGDYGWSAKQTLDGGFIVAGYTSSFGAGNYDYYLIKTGATGIREWDKTFGGSSGDFGWSVEQTADGGFIIGGSTFSFGAGGSDVYLIKTDANGNEEWNKPFGGTDGDYCRSVEQTVDGGFVLTGYSRSFGIGGGDVYVIKTTPIAEGVEDGGKNIALRFSLKQNYPNPFNPVTVIGYSLLVNGSVNVKVYNILGEEVATLINNKMMEAGEHSVEWNANNFASGVYFYRLNVNNGAFVETKKLVLVR